MASLPFTPTAGDIYELSATLEVQKAGATTFGIQLGFGAIQAGLYTESPILGRNEFIINGTNTAVPTSGAVTLTLDLDTTNAADWTVAVYANSTLLTTVDNVTQTISTIKFTVDSYTDGTMHDVSLVDLTDTGTSSGTTGSTGTGSTGSGTDVPEPASLAILGIGAIGLIATRRGASARR